MKRFRKAISVMLSLMLLFAFGMTANASQGTELNKEKQAIEADSSFQLTTNNEDVIEHLTRVDKPEVLHPPFITCRKISILKHQRHSL